MEEDKDFEKITWSEYNQLTIRDVPARWHKRIIDFMLEKFFRRHPLYKLMKIDEEEGVEDQYTAYLAHLLRGECSIMALDEQTNEIYAVVILKWMSEEWKSWICIDALFRYGKFGELITLCERMLLEQTIKNPDSTYDSMHLFDYYISEQYKYDDDFKERLIEAIILVTRHMKMSRVTFMTISDQQFDDFELMDFTVTCQTVYVMYTHNNTRPFSVLREADQEHALLLRRFVKPLTPYTDMTVREIPPTRQLLLQPEEEKKLII